MLSELASVEPRVVAGVIDFSVSHPDSDSDSSRINTAHRSVPAHARLAAADHCFGYFSSSDVNSISVGDSLAVADAEIHNRAELLRRLACSHLSPSCSDATLILETYQKWGENCPDFLLGEFSFAIWDANKQQLFCCRDHTGRRPFFYWVNGSRLAFSSDPLWLCSLPGIGRDLNRTKLAAWAATGVSGNSSPEETFYRGVMSLPSATSLTFARGRLTKCTYWDPEECAVNVPSKECEVFEALRDLLFDAVQCRILGKTRVAASLSGGLDSSALVSVAAKCLERSNRSVTAVAAILPEESKPQFTDEREFIDEFRTWPNVTIEYVAPQFGGPFDGIENPAGFSSNQLRNSRQYLHHAIQEAAFGRGADVILFGNGGEAGATTSGNGHYLELASRMKWYTLARELHRACAVRRTSAARIFGHEIRDFLSPERFEPLVLLAPDFMREIEDAPGHELHWPDHRRPQLRMIRAFMRAHTLRRGASQTLVPMAFPFLDKRVLEFCLAAPGHLKVRNGYSRYLIRQALDGILPKKIQWRTTKCAFSPDYPRRYVAQLGKARSFVASIRRKDPVRSIVDVDRLQYLLEFPNLPPGRFTALVVIPTTIYLICFLRQFAEFQP